MKKLTLLLTLLITAVAAQAGSVITYTTKSGEKIVINSKGRPSGEVFVSNVVSHTYENGVGKIVFREDLTTIPEGWFQQYDDLESISLPSTVKYILDMAFAYCKNLESIDIPESVEYVGGEVFYECNSLPVENGIRYAGNYLVGAVDKTRTTYTIKDGTKWIAMDAFRDCTNLTDITIPNSVEKIESNAFYGCTSLIKEEDDGLLYVGDCLVGRTGTDKTSYVIREGTKWICNNIFYIESTKSHPIESVVIPNTVRYIGAFAFGYCKNLKSVTLPSDLKYLNSAFNGCSGLTSITLPENLYALENSSFSGCTGLTSITIPSSVKILGGYVFGACSGLTSIEIPNSVDDMNSGCFSECPNLESVKIGDNVTNIGFSTFNGCKKLKSIEFGKSVKSIDSGLFDYYDNSPLTTVICHNPVPPICWNGGEHPFTNANLTACTLTVPTGSEAAYKAADVWKEFPTTKWSTKYNLTDGDIYVSAADHSGIDITYTRTFSNNTSWVPLYIPFSMDYADWSDKLDIAELAGVHMYEDRNPIFEYLTVKSGSLKPNVPYVVKAKNAGEMTINLTNKTLYAAPEEGTQYISCGSPRWTYKIYGNYHPMTGAELNETYRVDGVDPYIKTNTSFSHCNPSATLKAGRLFIVKHKAENGYWPVQAQNEQEDIIYFMVDGKLITDDDATGISTISTKRHDNAMYNLQGVRVNDDYKGIVIKNGKKTIKY